MATKRVMSEAEIRARKKYQAANSRATGALGLTALGGTLLATKRGQAGVGRAFKAVKRPVPERLSSEKIKSATTPILATSAGLGGLGSFNFAAYTGAEGNKGQRVKKNEDTPIEMGTYGEEGIAKNWEPTARNYSPEGSRAKRAKVYEAGSYGAAGGLAAVGGLKAAEGVVNHRKVEDKTLAAATARAKHKRSTHHVMDAAQHVRQGRAANKKAGMALAGAGAALGAGAAIGNWRKKEFGKSAFGVSHD